MTHGLGLPSAHVSLSHNYATTRSTDSLSQLICLETPSGSFYCMLQPLGVIFIESTLYMS